MSLVVLLFVVNGVDLRLRDTNEPARRVRMYRECLGRLLHGTRLYLPGDLVGGFVHHMEAVFVLKCRPKCARVDGAKELGDESLLRDGCPANSP